VNVLSLFSGIGGLELGLERAGMTVVGQVEKDPYNLRVLEKNYPGVAKHDDVLTAIDWWRSQRRPPVHLIALGFPCQPVSLAGRGLAQNDERWLWPAGADVIAELRPDWVVWENVPGLLTRGLDIVHGDLVRLGYRHRVGWASACSVGAPHMRRRLLGVAHASSVGWGERRPRGPVGEAADWGDEPAQGMGSNAAVRAASHWATEPGVARLVDGPADELAQRATGNAVVPQVGEYIGRLIMNCEAQGAA
jgi:DNA (cytosine-5)-methyltransferase 1